MCSAFQIYHVLQYPEYNFYPTALNVRVLFSPMVSGWAVGQSAGKVCPACISGTVRCRKLILGRDIG